MPVGIHKKQGAVYQIKTVADNIRLREALGKDASFEKNLLKSWSKVKGYEGAKQALATL